MKDKKVPEPDSSLLKLVCKYKPDLSLSTLNALFDSGYFSLALKVAKLVLISNSKDDALSAYGPLNLLDTAGDLFEKLIKPKAN